MLSFMFYSYPILYLKGFVEGEFTGEESGERTRGNILRSWAQKWPAGLGGGWGGCGTGSVSPTMTQALWSSSPPPGDSPRKQKHVRTQTPVRTVYTALVTRARKWETTPMFIKNGCVRSAACTGGRRSEVRSWFPRPHRWT